MPPPARRTDPAWRRSPGPGAAAPARSLADDLRGRSDDDLAHLLTVRPDLARPAPADFTALGARASTRASVQRVIERLDRAHWHTVQACVVAAKESAEGAGAGPISVDRIQHLLDDEGGDRVVPLLDDLWRLALLWSSDRGLELIRALPGLVGPHPANLGVPSAEIDPQYAAHAPPQGSALDRALAAAPAAALAILDRLTWDGPTGRIPATGAAHDGARWLIDQGLAAPTGVGHVTLVRDVALARRGGRLHRTPALEQPAPPTTVTDPVAVDQAAGAAARELLDWVDELAGLVDARPPRVLRSGGLGGRDVTRLAKELGAESAYVRWLLELIHAARLLADDGELVPLWALTPDYDDWHIRDPASRWADLVLAWLGSVRAAHLAEPGEPSRASSALGSDAQWPGIRALRADLFAELDTLPPGHSTDARGLLDLLSWRRPLRDPVVTEVAVPALVRELDWLGLTALGSLSSAGRALAAVASTPTAGTPTTDQISAVVGAAAAALPAPVDHVLLQADLTAVVPGPLDGPLGRFMRLVGDIESRGGATVLRFSPESLRRALDTGLTADEVLTTLTEASRTPVPQALDYLVRDVARRHGQTRVGGATAYVRSDDEALLASMLADQALAPALLRRIAPTVLVSRAEPAVLLETLREAGYAPAQEAFDGSLVTGAPRAHRAPPSHRPRAVAPVTSAGEPTVAADPASVIAAIRAAPPRPEPGPAPARVLDSTPADAVAFLHLAVADAQAVWIGYADGNGRTTRHLVRPIRIDGGRMYAVSTDSDAEQLFLLHRITGAAPA